MKKLLSVLVATVFIGSALPILSTQAGWDDRWSDVELMAAPNNFIRIPKRKTEIPQQRGYGVLYVDEDSSGMRLYFEDDAGDIVDLSEHSIPPDSVRLNNIGDPDGQTHFDLGDYRVVFETTGGDGPQFIIRSAFTGMEGGVLLRVNEGLLVPPSLDPRLADFNAVDKDVSGIRISNSHDTDGLPPEFFSWPHSLLELSYHNSEDPGSDTSYIRCQRQGGGLDFRVAGDGSVELSSSLKMREIPSPPGPPIADRGWLYLQDNGSGVSNLYFEDDSGLVHDLVSHDVPPGAILWNEIGNPTDNKAINFGTYRTVFDFGDTGAFPRLTLQTTEDLQGHSLLFLEQVGPTAVTVDSYLAYFVAQDPTARGIYVSNTAPTGFVAGHSLLNLHYTGAVTPANTDFLMCSDDVGEVFKITGQGVVHLDEKVIMKEIVATGTPALNYGWLYTQDNGSGASNLYFKDDGGVVHDLVSHDVPPEVILWNDLGNPTADKTINFGAYKTIFRFGLAGLQPRFSVISGDDLQGYSLFHVELIGATPGASSSAIASFITGDPTVRGVYIKHKGSTGFLADHNLLHLDFSSMTDPSTSYMLCSDVGGDDFRITAEGNTSLSGYLRVGMVGVPDLSLDAGDLYVQDEMEVDGEVILEDDVTINGVLDLNNYFLTQPNTIASQETLDLGDLTTPGSFHTVTGTNTIRYISAGQSDPGRIIVLKFTTVLTVENKGGGVGNFRLPANFVTTPNGILTLICDGTNWLEISRASNLN